MSNFIILPRASYSYFLVPIQRCCGFSNFRLPRSYLAKQKTQNIICIIWKHFWKECLNFPDCSCGKNIGAKKSKKQHNKNDQHLHKVLLRERLNFPQRFFFVLRGIYTKVLYKKCLRSSNGPCGESPGPKMENTKVFFFHLYIKVFQKTIRTQQ